MRQNPTSVKSSFLAVFGKKLSLKNEYFLIAMLLQLQLKKKKEEE